MADEDPSPPATPTPDAASAPAPRSRASPRTRKAAPAETPATTSPATPPAKESATAKSAPAKPKKDEEEERGAPKRPTLPARSVELLGVRRSVRRRRPIFGRQAANRYYRIGRDGAWRRPRGLQSKQRRHYGYRAEIVSIGYGSPARVRGLAPSGYRPVLVRTDAEIERLDPKLQAAIIARTVGTRRRLGLEETARKLGIRVLNPIQTAGEE
jgi:large subunit ribosomal protein L32e